MEKREYKFRVWDKATNKMTLPDTNNGYRIFTNGSVSYKDVWCTGDVILMQYTGLKDKNGTPIYEGDIVKIGAVIPTLVKKVVYIAPRFMLLDRNNKRGNFDLINTDEYIKMEVIGNIYEHPHLISSKQEE